MPFPSPIFPHFFLSSIRFPFVFLKTDNVISGKMYHSLFIHWVTLSVYACLIKFCFKLIRKFCLRFKGYSTRSRCKCILKHWSVRREGAFVVGRGINYCVPTIPVNPPLIVISKLQWPLKSPVITRLMTKAVIAPPAPGLMTKTQCHEIELC